MKVYIGDITKTKSDVIVNAADTDFTPGGGVARWIKKQGGEEIFKEAVKFTPGEIGKSYLTTAGNLEAKAVIHIPTVDWRSGTKMSLAEVNQSAVIAIGKTLKEGYKSIVFPLIASGTVGLNESKVALELYEAIIHMEEENPGFEGAIDVLNRQIFEKIKNSLPKDKYEVIEV